MYWYTRLKKLAQQPQRYWIAGLSKNPYPVGHMLRQEAVYQYDTQAEGAANDLNYRSPQNGFGVIYEVKLISEPVQPKSQSLYRSRTSRADVQVISPPKMTKKAEMQADEKQYVLLYTVRGESNGSHGGWDEDDTPAGDPSQHCQWTPSDDLRLVQQVEQRLHGQELVMTAKEDGSHHERWFRASVYVTVPVELDDQLRDEGVELPTGRLDYKNQERVVGRTPFQGVQQAVQDAATELGCNLPSQEHGQGDSIDWYKPQQPAQPTPPKPQAPDITKPKATQTPDQFYQGLVTLDRAKNPKRFPLQGD